MHAGWTMILAAIDPQRTYYPRAYTPRSLSTLFYLLSIEP